MVLGLFTFYAMAMLRFGILAGYWSERHFSGCFSRDVALGNSGFRWF